MVSLLNQRDVDYFSGHFSLSLTGYETDKAWRKEGQKLASTNPRFVSRPASHIPQVLTVATLTAAAAAGQKGGASTTKAPPTSGSGTDLDFKKAIHLQLQNALRLVVSHHPTISGPTARSSLTQEGKTVSSVRPQSAPNTPVKTLTSGTRTPSPSKNLSPSTQLQLMPGTVTCKLTGTTKVIASSPRKVASIGTSSQTLADTTSQGMEATATDVMSKKNKLSAIESLLCEETISPRNSPGPAKSLAKDVAPVVTPENMSPKVVQKAEISKSQQQRSESGESSSKKVVTVTAIQLKDHTEGEKEGDQPVAMKVSKSSGEETHNEVSSILPTTCAAGSEEVDESKLGTSISAAVVGTTSHPPVEQATLKEDTPSRQTTGGEVVASDTKKETSKSEDVAPATASIQVKVPTPSPSPLQSINSIPQQVVVHVTVNKLGKESESTPQSKVEIRIPKSNPLSLSTIVTPPPTAHKEGVDLSVPKSARKRSPSLSLLSEPPPPAKRLAIGQSLDDVVTTASPLSHSTPLLSTTAPTQASSVITPQSLLTDVTTSSQSAAKEAADLPMETSASSEAIPPLSTTSTATTTQASNITTTTVAVDTPVKKLTPVTSSQSVSFLSTTTAATKQQASNTVVVTTTAITETTQASSVASMAITSPSSSSSSQTTPLLSTAVAVKAQPPPTTAVTEATTICSMVKVPTLSSSTLTTPSLSNFSTTASSTATVTAPPPMETFLLFSSTQTTPLISNTTTMATQAPVTATVLRNSPLEALMPVTSEVDVTTPPQLQGEVSDSLIQSLCSDSTSFEEDPDVSVLASQLGIDSVDSPIFNLSGFLSFIQPDLSVLSPDGHAPPQADSEKLLGDALSMCGAEFDASQVTNLEGLERQDASRVDETQTQVQAKPDQLISLVQRMTTSVPDAQILSTSSNTSLQSGVTVSVSDAVATGIVASPTSSQQPPSQLPAVCSSTTAPIHPSLVPESITPAPFQPIPVQESISPASTQSVPVPKPIISAPVQPSLLPESITIPSLLPVPVPESITLAPIQPVSVSQSVTPSVSSTAILPEEPIPPRPLLLKLCGLPTCSLNLGETETSPLGSTPSTPPLPLTPTPQTPLREGLLDISDIGSLVDVSEAMEGISQDVFESIEKLVNLDEQSTNATWK